MLSKKIILHLCADIGSDSYFYQNDNEYDVIKVGKEIGVENYSSSQKIHGVIANPVCADFSTAKGFHKFNDIDRGMFLVKHCQRIIKESNPQWWVIENPAKGVLKTVLGKPRIVYQPWYYGSPWTKETALWGNFVMPKRLYNNWEDVPKIKELYI